MSNRRSLLIIDRDPGFRRNASRFLRDRGFEVVDVDSAADGLSELASLQPVFVLLDLGFKDPAALEILEIVVRSDFNPHVICIAGEAPVSVVVEAIKKGALDVLERPVDGEQLVALLNKTMDKASPGGLRPVSVTNRLDVDLLVTQSQAMQGVLETARKLADQPVVLLEGEPGVGLRAVAEFIHSASPRGEGPFIQVPQAPSIGQPEDYLFGAKDIPSAFAEAKGGVVFIEALSSLGTSGQERLGKLLQGLNSARVGGSEVRWPPMIGGTVRSLDAEVKMGRLREDIARVFSKVKLVVPPLRQRREDIPELIQRIVQGVQRQIGAAGVAVSPKVISTLVERDWPGNIPQLIQTIKEACCLVDGNTLVLDLSVRPQVKAPEPELVQEVPQEIGWRPTLDASGDVQPYDIYEAEIFRFALENAGGCVSRAAELLGVGRATMYRKMRAYSIDVPPVSERAIARSRGARKRRQEEREAAEARRRAFLEQTQTVHNVS